MPKTHLPGHLDSVRQTIRPKHQVLIAKCYPRLPKNSAADVKPNGSELSYLMYYAASHKSKLQKVGTFLEKKTANDVHKSQSARVLVTLQILTALLDNKAVGEGTGLALIAPHVMRIISGILDNTNDISLIEASQTTWHFFCKHQDQAVLAADNEYRELFSYTVDQYAQFAHKSGAKKLAKATTPVALHDAIRLRETGLHAFKSVLTSDVLALESGRTLLTTVIPAILGNLHGNGAKHVEHLLRVSKRTDSEEKGHAVDNRTSTATARTYTGQDTSNEADPRAAEGTAQDADAIAEEQVGILAMDCLKAVFATDNRAQVRSATTTVLKYLSDLQYYRRPSSSQKQISDLSVNTWATKVFELCTAWTPVQDRFILLVTAVEMLVRLPLKESDMRQHLLYASLIDHILKSELNLIGLSVMDVLLQLIQQILRVLHLDGTPPTTAFSNLASTPKTPTSTTSHPASTPEKPNSAASYSTPGKQTGSTPIDSTQDPPSGPRLNLMERLKSCIANLATHIYYTDQVSDMIGAILLRLKPNPTSNGQQAPAASAAAVEEPKTALSEVASNSGLPSSRGRSNSTTNGYFSFDTARQIALQAVRDIIRVANATRHDGNGGLADSRTPVHITTWEGTQWVLKDPSQKVRIAYVLALIAWLELETDKADSRLPEPNITPKKRQHAEFNTTDIAVARRAVSNASARPSTYNRDRAGQHRTGQQTFLQLLHVANYDNALQYAATSEVDILMMHTLLSTLVQRLGINAVASGMPMIFALQEDIARTKSPVAKVRMGSLVHGYLWALVEVFGGDESVAEQVLGEVKRRQEKSLWVKELHYPPMAMEKVVDRQASGFSVMTTITEEAIAREELKPFDDRKSLVASVVESYERSIASPPTSAPGSPRPFSPSASVERTPSNYLAAKKTEHVEMEPVAKRQTMREMMADWTREDAMLAIAAMAPRSVSLSGQSRSSPQNGVGGAAAVQAGNHRQLLAAANQGRRASGSESSAATKRAPTFEELKQRMAEPGFAVGGGSKAGSSGRGRMDVKALLASLPVDREEERGPRMGRPPY
ncbi:hypothetical protein B0A50_07006 [Salinomyces thailandicus]|uniref:Protein EFR3 n=1 Tax=Salinomyces thailandicus TaxID=706561 RepID=A0A4U0TP79_9PEZI|nr:hypothetical protein B0A50_07006 [Salinomyces thailandica]